MRRAILIIGGLIVVGLLAWEFLPVQVAVWDGHFPLTVHVHGDAVAVREVTCEPWYRRDIAEYVLEKRAPPEYGAFSEVVQPFDGESIIVHVPVSGKTSPLGRELNRVQFQYLVVLGELENGEQVGKIVDIPDGRVLREITVTMP